MVGECIESRLLVFVLLPCNVSFWGKKKEKETEDFLVLLIGMRERERERGKKKERKKTNAHMDLSDRLLLALSIRGLQSNLKVRCSN